MITSSDLFENICDKFVRVLEIRNSCLTIACLEKKSSKKINKQKTLYNSSRVKELLKRLVYLFEHDHPNAREDIVRVEETSHFVEDVDSSLPMIS